jgi:hypothetical protein
MGFYGGPIVSAAVLPHVSAGGKTDTTGGTEGRLTVTIVEKDTFRSQVINICSAYGTMSIAAKVVSTQLVGSNNE